MLDFEAQKSDSVEMNWIDNVQTKGKNSKTFCQFNEYLIEAVCLFT